MKNRYQVIQQTANFKTLIALGVVPINILDWKVIYEYYLSERDSLGKMQSYSNTAETYRISETHVRNIVKWMETD